MTPPSPGHRNQPEVVAGPRPQRHHRIPMATSTRRTATVSAAHYAGLAARLTPRDLWLIAMLHEHRVLTTHAITAMAFPSGRAARLRLRQLYDWDVIDRFQPRLRVGAAPHHYVLGGAGAGVLAAHAGIPTTALRYRREDVLAIAHHHTLAHTVAINDLFAQLVAHTIASLGGPKRRPMPDPGRHGAGVQLREWWPERRCHRIIGDIVRPDAYGHLTVATTRPRELVRFEWFLELDFATGSLTVLATKLDNYARLGELTDTPIPVLIWLPSPHREHTARTALHRVLRQLNQPDHVRVTTTHPADVHTAPRNYTGPAAAGDLSVQVGRAPDDHTGGLSWFDPAGSAWLPLRTAHDATTELGGRMSLAQLAHLWPAPPTGHAVLAAPPDNADHAGGTDPHGGDGGARRAGSDRVELAAPDPVPPAEHTYNPALPRPRTPRPPTPPQVRGA